MTTNNPYTFNNSPIEFILVGPRGGKDIVLVQSKAPGLDLFGLVNHRFEYLKDKSQGNLIASLLPVKYRQLNAIYSGHEFDVAPDLDNRYSTYRFIWVGSASQNDKHYFQREFLDSIPSIIQALSNKDDVALKILIGGLVLQCSNFNIRILRSKQSIRFVIIGYLLCGIVLLIYFLFVRFKLNRPKIG